MRFSIVLAVITAFLAGCATPEQQAARNAQKVDRLVQIYGPACDKLGYKSGTDQWRNCLLQLSVKDDMAHYSYSPYSYYGPYVSYYRMY